MISESDPNASPSSRRPRANASPIGSAQNPTPKPNVPRSKVLELPQTGQAVAVDDDVAAEVEAGGPTTTHCSPATIYLLPASRVSPWLQTQQIRSRLHVLHQYRCCRLQHSWWLVGQASSFLIEAGALIFVGFISRVIQHIPAHQDPVRSAGRLLTNLGFHCVPVVAILCLVACFGVLEQISEQIQAKGLPIYSGGDEGEHMGLFYALVWPKRTWRLEDLVDVRWKRGLYPHVSKKLAPLFRSKGSGWQGGLCLSQGFHRRRRDHSCW